MDKVDRSSVWALCVLGLTPSKRAALLKQLDFKLGAPLCPSHMCRYGSVWAACKSNSKQSCNLHMHFVVACLQLYALRYAAAASQGSCSMLRQCLQLAMALSPLTAEASCVCAVPEQNYVTMHWLDISCDLRRPFRSVPRDRVACRPLPFDTPLQGFPAVSCALRLSVPEASAVLSPSAI